MPNMLTVARIFLTCLLCVFVQQGLPGAIAALVIFLVAALTDVADGYVARRYDLITPFGKIMDPIADKCLVLVAFFMFAFEGFLPVWAVFIIAAREILVTSSRIDLMTNGKVLPAEGPGKLKTIVQMFAIFVILVYRAMWTFPETSAFIAYTKHSWDVGMKGLVVASVLLTVWSGVLYFRNLGEKKA
ncbi:MAG: CDP-diacylglycerol--glycerol-3-phosphate 3-phosphatidyltransferase, partial [Candidatus Omnitrophica bacterium]|nr:CDP-diacylglycerol--glycerol-3-phosphate 3-phosphatidyltransferase [Candidatus Omnitrophota bacterium]